MGTIERLTAQLRTSFVSAVLVLGLPAAAAEAPLPAHETLRLASTALLETRRINVYLPPDYDRNRDQSYPVLYAPDGGEEEDFPHLARAVDELIRAGRIRPLLLVGIENTQRRRDMTGPTQVDSDRKIAPHVGGSAQFRTFIARELMPVVQSRYRCSDEAAIIGESLAGLFIVETLFEQPQLFDAYIALDPSLWWNDRQWVRQAPERLPNLANVTLFVATGDPQLTNAREIAPFAEALRSHAGPAVRWHYVARDEYRHDTIYRATEREALTTVFGVGREAGVSASSAQP